MLRKELQKLVSQTAIYGLSTIIGRVINFLFVPLYTRVFLEQEYGTVTKLYSYSSFFLVILLFGMETAYFRFVKKEGNGNVFTSAFIPITVIAFAITFFLGLNASSLSSLINEDLVFPIQMMLAIICFDVIAALPFAKLRNENQAKRFAGIKLINIGLTVCLNLFFLLYAKGEYQETEDSFFYNPSIGVGYIFIANGIASFVTLILLSPDILKVKLKEVDFNVFKKMFRYGWPVMVLGIAGIINETLDRILLDYLLPGSDGERRAQIGIYGACYKLAIFISLIIQAYRYAAEPFFFSKAKDKDARETYAVMMNYFVIVVLIAALVILLFQDVFNLFIGEKFRVGVHIVPVLVYANLFLGIYYNLSVWYKLTDKTLLGAYVGIGGAVVTIVLNIVLIPIYGYYGAALTTLVCYILMALAAYLMGRKYYPIPYSSKILVYIFVSLGIYLGLRDITTSTVVFDYGLKALGVFVFVGFVFLLERRKA